MQCLPTMAFVVFLTEQTILILNLIFSQSRLKTLDVEIKIAPFKTDIFRSDPALYVSGNGYRTGLSLVLDAQLDEYSVTNGKFDGFKVNLLVY